MQIHMSLSHKQHYNSITLERCFGQCQKNFLVSIFNKQILKNMHQHIRDLVSFLNLDIGN